MIAPDRLNVHLWFTEPQHVLAALTPCITFVPPSNATSALAHRAHHIHRQHSLVCATELAIWTLQSQTIGCNFETIVE